MSNSLQLEMSASRSRLWWVSGTFVLAGSAMVVALWMAEGSGSALVKTAGLNNGPPQGRSTPSKPADGTGLASLQGDGSAALVKASPTKPSLGDPERVAELKKIADEVHEKLKRLSHEYDSELERFLSTRPDLAQWHHMATLYEMEYHRQERQQSDYLLRHYTTSPVQGAGDANGGDLKAREQEVAQARQFLFLKEVGSLLDDERSGQAVSTWLQERLRTLNSSDGPLLNSASASDFSGIGDALFPDAANLRALMTATDREAFINAYAAQKGLGTVDNSMRPEVAEHLRQLLHFGILSDAASNMVTSQLSAPLLKMNRDINTLQKQRYGISRQIAALSH